MDNIDQMGIDKVGIDKVRIDKVRIDKVGIDKVRRYYLAQCVLEISYFYATR